MNPITEDDIAQFLVNTPGFFERHAELLGSIQLTSPHGQRAVSLQERQVEMLREKIHRLELSAADMIRHGQENVGIADKLQRWTLRLLLAREARTLPDVVTQELQAQFQVPQAAVRLWGVAPAFEADPVARDVSEQVRSFAASLTLPYCGANPGLEAVQWLADPAAAASIALIPLREEGHGAATFGLLVLASPESGRFHANMGTDFLERIGELASAALARLRPLPPSGAVA